MSIPTSSNWDAQNMAHRFTVSFFKAIYSDDPLFVTSSSERKNSELNYYNLAATDNIIQGQICAGSCIVYMENQGLSYHQDKKREDLFTMLAAHLAKSDGLVLYTADIIDYFFKFAGEF
jgi:hypothetical protein